MVLRVFFNLNDSVILYSGLLASGMKHGRKGGNPCMFQCSMDGNWGRAQAVAKPAFHTNHLLSHPKAW